MPLVMPGALRKSARSAQYDTFTPIVTCASL